VAVVHHHWHRNDDLPPSVPQRFERVTIWLQHRGRPIELLEDIVERIVMDARG
jgi:hypothetical protein